MAEKTDKDFIKELLEQLLPQALAAGIAMAKPKTPDVKVFDRSTCSECKQMRGACGGKHELACIYPQGEEFETFFQGVTLNGITYNSGANRIPIPVPKGSGLANTVSLWEQQEKNQRYGIKRKDVNRRIASTV